MVVPLYLSPHLQKFWRRAPPSLGARTEGSNILSDVVAHVSVPPRCRLAQSAVFVNERNGNAVHLWLDHHRYLFVRQKPLNTGVKIFHFLFRVSVIETEHWDQMRNLLERFKRFSADSLSG